jgi:predicted transcriptional regulator with HTH domain
LPLDYKYTYKDILIPVNISNLNRGDTQMLYLYYLYHIAPIYNWLREIKVVGEIKNDTGID